jgi:hypothetical protein
VRRNPRTTHIIKTRDGPECKQRYRFPQLSLVFHGFLLVLIELFRQPNVSPFSEQSFRTRNNAKETTHPAKSQKRMRVFFCCSFKAVKDQNVGSKSGSTRTPRTSEPEFSC